MSDRPQRAAEAVALFENTVRQLRAAPGNDDPLEIADAAFGALDGRYPDLTAGEAERMAAIRLFNAMSALFETERHRSPNTVEELYEWLATRQGRAAYQRAGRRRQ